MKEMIKQVERGRCRKKIVIEVQMAGKEQRREKKTVLKGNHLQNKTGCYLKQRLSGWREHGDGKNAAESNKPLKLKWIQEFLGGVFTLVLTNSVKLKSDKLGDVTLMFLRKYHKLFRIHKWL